MVERIIVVKLLLGNVRQRRETAEEGHLAQGHGGGGCIQLDKDAGTMVHARMDSNNVSGLLCIKDERAIIILTVME